MSGVSGKFRSQQQQVLGEDRHPSVRHKDMEDKEKIQHLQKEIDNLRDRIRDANGGSLNDSLLKENTSTAAATGHLGLLTVLLFVAVLVVGIWRRRRRLQAYAFYTKATQEDDLALTFELQDAHVAPEASSSAANNAATYVAPTATAANVQFV